MLEISRSAWLTAFSLCRSGRRLAPRYFASILFRCLYFIKPSRIHFEDVFAIRVGEPAEALDERLEIVHGPTGAWVDGRSGARALGSEHATADAHDFEQQFQCFSGVETRIVMQFL